MNGYTAETIKDRIESFGKGTIIQHGKLNDRVYLIKLNKDDFPEAIDYIDLLAKKEAYTKIFCKIPSWAAPLFFSKGFIIEAHIPDFYLGNEDVFFMSKFLNSDRLLNIENNKLNELSGLLSNPVKNQAGFSLKKTYKLLFLKEENAEEIANLYKKVFDSYPFPIFDPEYIIQTMKSHVQYYGIEKSGKLIALASAEIDKPGKNAEMTDFATLPEFRGNNLSVIILVEMEKKMLAQGIKTLYTIARLNSLPMNKTFLKLNYKYAGTLIKNTNISGKIESMNVLFKHI